MHFNTINTGILDLSEMAIRANKALRGAVGVFCLSGGQENSGGHVRRGNKKTGWMETQQCTNTPKHQTNEGRHKGSETERTCHPTTCAHTHIHTHTVPPHTASISVSIILPWFPLSSRHSHSLTHLMTHAGSPPTCRIRILKIKPRQPQDVLKRLDG